MKIFFYLIMISALLNAAAYYVPDDWPSFEMALDSTESGDTIYIRPGHREYHRSSFHFSNRHIEGLSVAHPESCYIGYRITMHQFSTLKNIKCDIVELFQAATSVPDTADTITIENCHISYGVLLYLNFYYFYYDTIPDPNVITVIKDCDIGSETDSSWWTFYNGYGTPAGFSFPHRSGYYGPSMYEFETTLHVYRNRIYNRIAGFSYILTYYYLAILPFIDMDLRYNWWGTTDTAYISRKIVDDRDSPENECHYPWFPILDSSYTTLSPSEIDTTLWGIHYNDFIDCDWYATIIDPVNSIGENITYQPSSLTFSAFPNPFNSAINISAPEEAEIKIFDINGRCIAEFDGGDRIWQPEESVGSGVYLVRAKIGDKDITKRVVYLK